MNERCKHIGKDGHRCGSYAFNLYKDDIEQDDLCDVHYWQTKAQRTWVGIDWSEMPDEQFDNYHFRDGATWAEQHLKEKNT